jgi:hypothetical protein
MSYVLKIDNGINKGSVGECILFREPLSKSSLDAFA